MASASASATSRSLSGNGAGGGGKTGITDASRGVESNAKPSVWVPTGGAAATIAETTEDAEAADAAEVAEPIGVCTVAEAADVIEASKAEAAVAVEAVELRGCGVVAFIPVEAKPLAAKLATLESAIPAFAANGGRTPRR